MFRMNTQIIGMDLADKRFEDYSVVSSICGNCMTVIESKPHPNKENKLKMTIFKRCPYCETKFTRHIIRQ